MRAIPPYAAFASASSADSARVARARDDQAEDAVLVGVPDVAVADVLAALQDHHPVADGEDVLQAGAR